MFTIDKESRTKMLRFLLLFPIIPSIIVYFRISLFWAIMILVAFWATALISASNEEFAAFLYNVSKKIFRIIGNLISVIALVIIYICAVLPTGILTKLVKRDRLVLKKKENETYWKDQQNSLPSYEFQF